jgi:protein DGCR14
MYIQSHSSSCWIDRPKSPTINNFSLVAHMPSPTPEELGPTAVKQLMTWGSLNATPRILQSSDSDIPLDPNRPFHLPAPSQREALSHRLSNKASKDIRERANLMSTTPRRRDDATPKGSALGRTIRSSSGAMAPPSWTPGARTATRHVPPAQGALTPAAKRLLERTAFGAAGARRAEVMAQAAGWDGPRAGSAGKDMNQVRWTPTPARKT